MCFFVGLKHADQSVFSVTLQLHDLTWCEALNSSSNWAKLSHKSFWSLVVWLILGVLIWFYHPLTGIIISHDRNLKSNRGFHHQFLFAQGTRNWAKWSKSRTKGWTWIQNQFQWNNETNWDNNKHQLQLQLETIEMPFVEGICFMIFAALGVDM